MGLLQRLSSGKPLSRRKNPGFILRLAAKAEKRWKEARPGPGKRLPDEV
jgi:hypothetical protein